MFYVIAAAGNAQEVSWVVEIQAWAALAAAFVALGALIASLIVHSRQSALTQTIHNEQSSLTRSIHDEQQKLHDEQLLLTQRQLLLPLWDSLHKLRQINPNDPIWPDVLYAANTLELIALCVEAEIIDPQLIRRTFRDEFVKIYEQIESCPAKGPQGDNRSGKDVLRQNQSATKLYDEYRKELANQNAIGPISKREESK